MHGCAPLDGNYHTITKIDGANLYELAGKPIVKVIDDIFGGSGWQKQKPVINLLTVAINCGDRFVENPEVS